jgi:hypothetical protein
MKRRMALMAKADRAMRKRRRTKARLKADNALLDMQERMLNPKRRRARRAVAQYGLMVDERDPHDNYETPPDAVHQLLSNVRLEGGIWEPSCGRGKLVEALLDAGIHRSKIAASDKYLEPRSVEGEARSVLPYACDLMRTSEMPLRTRNVVMNPPFSASDEHVRHCLRLVPHNGVVCALLRLTWIAARKRSDLLRHLSKIIIVGRLKMLPPDVPDRGHNGAVDFAWFVFVSRVVTATEIVRAK